MNKVIWKFPLRTTDVQTVEVPSDHEILTIQIQNGIPCMWVLVSPDAPMIKIVIEIFGTGNPVEKGLRKYIGTYQIKGPLVFHCFQFLGV
jgi:hypothetical protein